jgi:hypothetical protein
MGAAGAGRMAEHERQAATRAEETTFERALDSTRSQRRHLLLGNGFSIGVHPSFGYDRLFEEAAFVDPDLKRLFEPGDTNFENALKLCSTDADAERIKAGLIRAVAAVHPEHSLRLTEEQCRSCWAFLANFVGRQRKPLGSLFTTNYDLLLHWVLSRQGKNPGTKQFSPLKCWDGFSSAGYWDPYADAQAWYLHGAVHIYERPNARLPGQVYTQMLRWEVGRPLKRQVDACLRGGRFPVFVAAGTSAEKTTLQGRWEYLRRAKQRFRNTCKESESVIFTAGHSFGESDDHIAAYVGKGTVRAVFIGVYSAADKARANELANDWAAARTSAGAPPVSVSWFDVRECSIWDRLTEQVAA